jgi:hypothetical protein
MRPRWRERETRRCYADDRADEVLAERAVGRVGARALRSVMRLDVARAARRAGILLEPRVGPRGRSRQHELQDGTNQPDDASQARATHEANDTRQRVGCKACRVRYTGLIEDRPIIVYRRSILEAGIGTASPDANGGYRRRRRRAATPADPATPAAVAVPDRLAARGPAAMSVGQSRQTLRPSGEASALQGAGAAASQRLPRHR